MKATQYAKSTDPEVIAAIEENERSRRAWIDAALHRLHPRQTMREMS